MRSGTLAHRAGVWVALIALLFASLAPSASLAFADNTASKGYWAALCGMDGARSVWVDLDDGLQTDDAGSSHSSAAGHCLFCHHLGGMAPPPDVVMLVHAADNRVLLPRQYYHAPKPLFAWSSRKSRAPPSLS